MNIKQRKILHLLETCNGQKYSGLYKNFNEEDKFPYHLKHLVSKRYINKRNNAYFLTRLGAQTTQDFNSSTLEERKLKIPINVFVCKCQDKFLIRKTYSEDICYALPGIKAEWGATYDKDMSTQFQKKFGATIKKIVYRSTLHLLERTTNNEIMFDDILLIFDVEIDQILETDKQFRWLTLEEIQKLPNKHKPVDIYLLENSQQKFMEILVTSNFNLQAEDL
ncbi:hypothetical protein CO112_00840 [Candidatus Dojkabacteria bacterium CG_4_9_14_3_um_filter_150_Dojkabacteria_WS6_41_13]|uniref:Nudix hydrolase domain-containing protein n=1 Tax=Candidatus Dojkabacteria bacterium CG_4_10_14_0_2_um_filter_Dojkabacteria_WS6_41_15 TaxID=2014249 RepID=A0A2M7W2T3_9BACT|nr:MAG: hypothetical protein COZ14_04735 [Candidatus Dojkabacteria bacterium CG_4_10_14_3_um_filter_Dojkabacteria_WS6_41_9]PJA15200.1 MAG: hypothetical protein COX64_01030 [Candidatus Dojkabacteria bacterium CG_4_10_14_0_2_um_filter_Dojkabacteria_WS6_41_15]PJB23517.1 MAG: hypothetical protein CO112_00840 [Candidatus Dojkabacteria bacterium CG_4_9_14_3_um_filter_150_Dojkabacteria_WS6_41_13]